TGGGQSTALAATTASGGRPTYRQSSAAQRTRQTTDPPSIHVLAAVHGEGRPGNEVGVVRDQEQDGPRYIFGLSEPADRDPRNDFFEHVGRNRAHHVGIDIAGRDRIDGDPAPGSLLRQGLGKAVDARFRRSVIDLTVLSRLTVDRADVHD